MTMDVLPTPSPPVGEVTDSNEMSRSIRERAADALDNAPPYVREIMATLSEINARRLARGQHMINGDGTPLPHTSTLGRWINRSD